MEITLNIKKTFKVKYLKAKCKVRYWEDAEINGKSSEDGELVPCKKGDYWCPNIDIEKGKITNWEHGKSASIHFKVCDAGTYELTDFEENTIIELDGYVPDVMSPKEPGYGDYIIMDIDEEGFIDKWQPDFTEFENEEE